MAVYGLQFGSKYAMCATDNCESIIFSFRLSDMPPSNNEEVMDMVSEILGRGLNPTIYLKVHMTSKTYGSTKCYACEIRYTDCPVDETVFNRRVSLLKKPIFDTILIGGLDLPRLCNDNQYGEFVYKNVIRYGRLLMLYEEEMENKRMGCYVGTITDIDGILGIKLDGSIGHEAKRDFDYKKYFDLNKEVASYRRI